jgi:hypothetical protein
MRRVDPAAFNFDEASFRQGVGLVVEHSVALLDGTLADRLSQMALAGAGRPQKQSIFMTGDEAAGGEIDRPGFDSSSC